MKNIKKGFTLSELVVTLGIVGVVAALVVPQFIGSASKDKRGALLGRAVQQIELGCQNLIQDYNSENASKGSFADNIEALDGDYEFSMEKLLPYIGANKINGSENKTRFRFEKFPVEGEYEAFSEKKKEELIDDRPYIGSLIIDLNGFGEGINKGGKDRFNFYLLESGTLEPWGLHRNTCEGDNPKTIDENCTARVVKDGFKIKYNY